ncbi:MAG: AAA family ATPase [Micrococcales bacterium]|nr:AAA family ATPase [Micrococcales bacterium]
MDATIDALRNAVAALPQDLDLRLHLAEVELGAGLVDAAIADVLAALAIDSGHARARELMAQAIAAARPEPETSVAAGVAAAPGPARANGVDAPNPAPEAAAVPDLTPATGGEVPDLAPAAGVGVVPDPGPADAPVPGQGAAGSQFNWSQAEADLGSDVPPPFVSVSADGDTGGSDDLYLAERPRTTLADVGGMAEVKQRLTVSFLAPLRNPELRKMYGKSLRGGLLMYGPPGCGKTFIARAVAGELGAAFLSVGVTDVLNRWLGESENNLHRLFQQARRLAPCVVFLDELDTLGHRRSNASDSMVSVVNQLLTELDGVEDSNAGVFVLGATNQPWQVDPALRRPGRFDRTVVVLPPDEPARQAVFHHHLADRPVAGVDLARLARMTDGCTGADIALICESATEAALMDSVRTGEPRMITMADLERAATATRSSIGAWLETARNIVTYGEDDGTFAELRAYLKKTKRL